MCKQTRVCVRGIGGVRSEKEWPIGRSLWRKTSPVTPTPNKTHNSLTSQQSKESHNSSISFKSHGFLFHIFIQLTPQSNGFYRPLTLFLVYLWFLHLLYSAFLYNLWFPLFPFHPHLQSPPPSWHYSFKSPTRSPEKQPFLTASLFSNKRFPQIPLRAQKSRAIGSPALCPPYRQLLGHPSYRCPPRSCFLLLQPNSHPPTAHARPGYLRTRCR